MSLTYTSASERDVRHIAAGNARLRSGHLLLALTSVVAMLVLGSAYSGRSIKSSNLTNVTNLNAVSDSKQLDPLFEHLYADSAERRAAAQSLFKFIDSIRKSGDSLPNVGAIRPLFTASDLATIKPFIVVRTPETFTNLTLFWGALYFSSFWALALIWRLRGIRGDCLLLAAAHLLTAIGFAALLSRADPFRDNVL